jgi:hypothetical protein
MQTFCASSVQTLMQGDSTRGSGMAGGVMAMGTDVELWGSLAYSSNAFFPSRLKRFDRTTSAPACAPDYKNFEEAQAL